jgi:hypothetical protein
VRRSTAWAIAALLLLGTHADARDPATPAPTPTTSGGIAPDVLQGRTVTHDVVHGAFTIGGPKDGPTRILNVGDLEPRPAATCGSFAGACDSLVAVVRSTVAARADSLTFARTRVTFTFRDRWVVQHEKKSGGMWWTRQERDSLVPALRVVLVTSSWKAPASEEILDALRRAGWAEDPWFSADGPDGMSAGLACREALCEIRASWDGGDDSDSTVVAKPGQRVELTCVPWTRHPDPH